MALPAGGGAFEHLFGQQLVEALPDGVFVAQDERFVYANPALLRRLSYDAEGFSGLSFAQVLAPHCLAVWTERYRLRVGPGAEPVKAYEVDFIARDGESVPFELLANRVAHGGRPAVLGVLRDIGERRRVAAELDRHRHHLQELVDERTRDLQQAVAARLETEHFAQSVTDNQPTLIAYVDRQQALRFANRAFLAWFGMCREDVIDKPVTEVAAQAIGVFDPAMGAGLFDA